MRRRYGAWAQGCTAACGLMLASAGWAGHGAAGEGEVLADIGLENLLDLEVYTASRFPQARADAPSALTVITAEQIALYGFRGLDEILRSIPGVHISYDHAYRYIGVRGLRRPQDFNSPVLLLVDGQRLNEGLYDSAPIGPDFPVDVELIERVEFVRGPGSAVYGANALLGVLNVITREPGAAAGARLGLQGGDAGAARASAQLDIPLADQAAGLLLSASYGRREGDDLYLPAFDSPETNNGIANNLDHARQRRLMAKLSAGDWRLQAVYGEREKAVPLPIYGADFNDPRNRYADHHAFASLVYEGELDDRWLLHARLANGYYRFDGDLAYDGVLNQDRARSQRWNTDLRLQFRGWNGHRLSGGLEYIDDYRQDQFNFDEAPYRLVFKSHGDSRSGGLFLQDEWQLRDNLRLTGGLRHDRVRGQSMTSPRLALIAQPARGHHLKLLYGRAFRTPSVYERDYAGEGYSANPALRAERTTNADLHWEAYLSSTLKLQLSLQHFVIDDFIVEGREPQSGNLQYVNGAEVHSRSVDAGLEKYWRGGLAGRASLSLQRVRAHGSGEPIDAPELLGKFALSMPLPWRTARAALEIQGVGERRTLAGRTGGYALANLTLSSLRLGEGLSLAGSIYNLFDQHYADPLSSDLAEQGVDRAPQRGREFRVSLDWAW